MRQEELGDLTQALEDKRGRKNFFLPHLPSKACVKSPSSFCLVYLLKPVLNRPVLPVSVTK
jgi:hypothetical protein